MGAEAEGLRFHGCPQRAHFAFASNIHRLPCQLLLLLLSLSLHLARCAVSPRGGARLAPTVLIFIHSVNMQISRPEPGLASPGLSWPGLVVTRRATSPQAPIVLAEFSQQRLAASKPFWPNVFFFWPVAEPIKHAAAPHFSSCHPQLMIRFSA